jgi:hypothetical protein
MLESANPMTPASPIEISSRLLIGGVWVFHGLYSKILNGIPRHRMIVGRIFGDELAGPIVMTIGALEIALGLWALSGRWRIPCALVQTLAIASMNAIEILRAKDLLISAVGMLVLNAAFLFLVWCWALRLWVFSETNPRRLNTSADGV